MKTARTIDLIQTPGTLLPGDIERLCSVEGITEFRLPNGLRVLLLPDPSTPTITVNITYLVGSAHESYGETGMAHLLEHLLFKGTPRHPNIPQELTAHGANANATTCFVRTNYYETFAATDENLAWALELEADRMVNSFIAQDDLDSEMTVVRNEMERNENDPDRILMQRVMAAAFEWHNYGKPTIGARSDVENVPIERLQVFYESHYRPDRAVLTVAGKIDEARTLELIHKYFGSIARAERKSPMIYTVEPTQEGERSVTLRRVGATQLIKAAYHAPAGPDLDSAPLSILIEILGHTPSGRLYEALVATKLSTSVNYGMFRLKDPGLLFFSAVVRSGEALDPVQDILLKTIEGIAAQPPTQIEVERARTRLLSAIDLKLNSSTKLALELSEWIAKGDWRLFFLHRDRLRGVTPEDVGRVAARYLVSSNRTVGRFIPTERPVRAEIRQLKQTDVVEMLKDYKGEAPAAAGEAFDPSPANIEARAVRTAVPGGLKVALLPKRTRGQMVEAALILRFGDEKSLRNRGPAGDFVGEMLRRGTTQRTRRQIKDDLEKLRANLTIRSSQTSASVALKTTRETLPEVIRLMAEVLREPSFPEEEFDQLKRQRLTHVESQKSEPPSIAATALKRHLNPYPNIDVRYTPGHDELIDRIKALTLDDVTNFYAEYYGASNAQISVVGDFDETEVGDLAAELFGGWASPGRYERVARNHFDISPINRMIETPDKANAYFICGQNLKLRDDDPDYPALVLGDFMIGGGFLNSRLAVRIRQQEGLSYNVQSILSESSLDQSSHFHIFAIAAPQNIAKLETAVYEEVARILADGFTPDEVSSAKHGYLQSREIRRTRDHELAGTLTHYLYLERTFAWDAEIERKIAALAAAEVTAAVRRHIDLEKFSIIKAGDFRAPIVKPVWQERLAATIR